MRPVNRYNTVSGVRSVSLFCRYTLNAYIFSNDSNDVAVRLLVSGIKHIFENRLPRAARSDRLRFAVPGRAVAIRAAAAGNFSHVHGAIWVLKRLFCYFETRTVPACSTHVYSIIVQFINRRVRIGSVCSSSARTIDSVVRSGAVCMRRL